MSALVFACAGKAADTAEPGRADTGTVRDTATDPDTETSRCGCPDDADCTALDNVLTAEGVELCINNGAGRYRFGLVQAGTADNWTGEDCWRGDTLEDGEVVSACHDAYSGLTVLTLGELPLEEGETLFHDGMPGAVGYYLEDSTGACYVWGDAASWWDELGCAWL